MFLVTFYFISRFQQCPSDFLAAFQSALKTHVDDKFGQDEREKDALPTHVDDKFGQDESALPPLRVNIS